MIVLENHEFEHDSLTKEGYQLEALELSHILRAEVSVCFYLQITSADEASS